jgi:hypothetical protein
MTFFMQVALGVEDPPSTSESEVTRKSIRFVAYNDTR